MYCTTIGNNIREANEKYMCMCVSCDRREHRIEFSFFVFRFSFFVFRLCCVLLCVRTELRCERSELHCRECRDGDWLGIGIGWALRGERGLGCVRVRFISSLRLDTEQWEASRHCCRLYIQAYDIWFQQLLRQISRLHGLRTDWETFGFSSMSSFNYAQAQCISWSDSM